MEAEAGVEPLCLRRESQTLKYWARIKCRGDKNPLNEILGDGYFAKSRYRNPKLPFGAYAQALAESAGLEDLRVADLSSKIEHPWLLSPPQIDLSLTSIIDKSVLPHLVKTEFQINTLKYNEYTSFYTDGSKQPETGVVASAFNIPSINLTFNQRLSNNLSIYTAELVAIDTCMSWIIDHKPSKSIIYSDSLSSLQSIQNMYSKSRPDILNQILIKYKIIKDLGLDLILFWCPAHVGIRGNEEVDSEAKAGLERVAIDNHISIAPTEIYSLIKKRNRSEWFKYYSTNYTNNNDNMTYSVGLRWPEKYSNNYIVDKCIGRLRMGTSLLSGSIGRFILGSNPTLSL